MLVYFPSVSSAFCRFFFFNDTATTEIYTLSLHDALPIYDDLVLAAWHRQDPSARDLPAVHRSEEHTSELQSLRHLVCRLLLDKKKSNGEGGDQPTRSRCPRVPGLGISHAHLLGLLSR